MSDDSNTTILLLGLDETLAAELQCVLANQRQTVHTRPFLAPRECIDAIDELGARAVFCASDREQYMATLDAMGREKPQLPVIVVSRVPEVSEWLDAIEAGASDYCAAPFEESHIRWILESALKQRSAPALRRTA